MVAYMFPEAFSTDRLDFERFCRRNVSPTALYEIVSTRSETIREETAYLPWDPVRTMKESAERIEAFERQWDELDRAEWLIRRGPDADDATEIVGSAGIICEWAKDLAILAIWLRKPYWGQRYSGERADALLEIAFERLDFDVVAIPLHSENTNSYRAVGRYVDRHGGRYEGVLRNHAGRYDEPVDHHRFTISQREYRSANGAETAVRFSE